MENKLRKDTCMANTNPPCLAMHKHSQTISKIKPRIRIIHIFAPEIIKTDVENFRELVQRLTGKPTAEKFCKKKPRDQDASWSSNGLSEKPKMTMKMELRNGFWGSDQSGDRVKEEVGRLCNNEISGGYLGGFPDLEGFISEFGEFPLLPWDGTHHMQGFEEPQLS